MSEAAACPDVEEGLPAWVMTFADLMSLLMVFFVLLLSFAQIDAQKFKQIAGSLSAAFGVQRDVYAEEIPMGVSVIAQEFSPSVAQHSVLDEVRQQTTDDTKQNLDVAEAYQQQLQILAQAKSEEVEKGLKKEIEEGMVSVETDGEKVIIRIQERGSFTSGSSDLDPSFISVMERITSMLVDTQGQIVVAGHTDNIPISTARYRSNWELSAARAVTVVHQLVSKGMVTADRVLVEGRADTQPLVPNDTPENRAKNRRVEIILLQGEVREEEIQVVVDVEESVKSSSSSSDTIEDLSVDVWEGVRE